MIGRFLIYKVRVFLRQVKLERTSKPNLSRATQPVFEMIFFQFASETGGFPKVRCCWGRLSSVYRSHLLILELSSSSSRNMIVVTREPKFHPSTVQPSTVQPSSVQPSTEQDNYISLHKFKFALKLKGIQEANHKILYAQETTRATMGMM